MEEKKKIKLKVDQEECIRCGACAMLYKKYFSIKEDGDIDDSKAVVPEEKTEDIMQSCPVGAIVVDN